MNRPSRRTLIRELGRPLLAALLLAGEWPAGLAPLCTLAGAGLLARFVQDARPRTRLRRGFVFGLFFWLILVHWLFLVVQYCGPAVALGVGLLVLALALYTAGVILVAGAVQRPLAGALWFALVWTAGEFLRSLGPLSFSWGYLGHACWGWPAARLLAGCTGVPGLSFLLALNGALLARTLAGRAPQSSATDTAAPRPGIALAVLALSLGLVALVAQRQPATAPASTTLQVALVQGNVAQHEKWELGWRNSLLLYEDLTRTARQQAPRLVVWPEVALTQFYGPGRSLTPALHDVVDEASHALVTGALSTHTTADGTTRYYNSAVLLQPGPAGAIQARVYPKRHLLPFGEYVPLQEYLPFVQRIVESADGGAFTPGARAAFWDVDGVTLAPVICFESAVPGLVRRLVVRGADVLLVLTNDAWFEPSFGPAQHLRQAVFRAAENGVPVLHCANTGPTCVIDETGAITRRLPRRTREVLAVTLAVRSRPTFYRVYGAVCGWTLTGAVALCAVFFALKRVARP